MSGIAFSLALSAACSSMIFSQASAILRIPNLPISVQEFHKAAIFGSDRRQAVSDLFDRDPGSLTIEERAVLQAAPRIGQILCGSAGYNATLIQLKDGRDAVIASGHAFRHKATGVAKCDLREIAYLPNVSFFTGEPNDFNNAMIMTDGSLPFNSDIVGRPGEISVERDFLVFVLSARPSRDILPNGSVRGFMKLASSVDGVGERFQIGFSSSFREAETPSYEECHSGVEPTTPNTLYHFCASKDSSSGSALTELVNEEFVLSGLHKAEWDVYNDMKVVPTPSELKLGNLGISIEAVKKFLAEKGHPAVVDTGILL